MSHTDHFSSVWVFVHERGTTDMVPHLTRGHSEYNRLERENKGKVKKTFSWIGQVKNRIHPGNWPELQYPMKFYCTGTPGCCVSGTEALQSERRGEPRRAYRSSWVDGTHGPENTKDRVKRRLVLKGPEGLWPYLNISPLSDELGNLFSSKTNTGRHREPY